MASLNGRIRKLEGHIPPPAELEKGEEARREIMFAVLDEIGRLKACRSNRSYRGGLPIQPTDPTGDALGYPYTHGESTEFAVRRAIERFDFPKDSEAAEELITSWVAELRSVSGPRWDEVDAEGPPEPTPPWH